MVKKQKLFQKLLNSPRNILFNEFTTILEAFGFKFRHVTGSHHVYKHPDVADLLSIQPGKDGKAKPYQIRQFLKLVEEYNLTMDVEGKE
jgi:predicted RNA binding protein YcfA (HicA-like mRNA interferase family)